GVQKAQYEGASERKGKRSWAPGKITGSEDYLLQLTIPNTFFHVAMAYAVLRHNGVDIGKMDFLDPINLADARSVCRDRNGLIVSSRAARGERHVPRREGRAI